VVVADLGVVAVVGGLFTTLFKAVDILVLVIENLPALTLFGRTVTSICTFPLVAESLNGPKVIFVTLLSTLLKAANSSVFNVFMAAVLAFNSFAL
jgi:hypothetical protein